MASWTLGKIFENGDEPKVEEPDNAIGRRRVDDNNDDDDDDSDSSDEEDEDTLERQAAFNKNKANSSTTSNPTASNRSIRRYDELGNFISRSERARSDKDKEFTEKMGVLKTGDNIQKASAKKDGGLFGKRRIQFKSEDELLDILEIPYMTAEEKASCFMGRANWDSIDTDIEITTKRWKNHTDGRIKFDEDNNTLRGIEDLIFKRNKGKPMYYHRKAVLEEAVRQKTEKDWINWDKMSSISSESSKPQYEEARQLGLEDETESIRCWVVQKAPPTTSFTSGPASNKKDKSKRKSSFFGLFKKK